MDYTQGTEKYKRDRAKKMMLWFGIISLTMTFAALISSYIVSKERRDWLESYDFPNAFIYSTLILVGSSVVLHIARSLIIKNDKGAGFVWLSVAFVMGIIFVVLQVNGFQELTDQGYYLTGKSSNITTTFLFVIIGLHVLHVIAGFIVLITLITQTLRGRYHSEEHVGLDIGIGFWHFLDVIWVLLFLFLYFVR